MGRGGDGDAEYGAQILTSAPRKCQRRLGGLAARQEAGREGHSVPVLRERRDREAGGGRYAKWKSETDQDGEKRETRGKRCRGADGRERVGERLKEEERKVGGRWREEKRDCGLVYGSAHRLVDSTPFRL